jgi:diadenosine hexaphosphate hydrolase (ATP-forming)
LRGADTFPVSVGVLEILVAGVTASIWFGMFVAALAGFSEPPNWLSASPATTLLVYGALAYGLGVIVDGVADAAFIWMLDHGQRHPPKDSIALARAAMTIVSPRGGDDPLPGRTFQMLREEALIRDDGLARFMEYQRSRQRLARAMAVNLLLALPIGIWFFVTTVEAGTGVVIGFTSAALIGILVSGRTAERLRQNYERHLTRLPALGTGEALARIRAAAVCFRATSSAAEILVVQTKEPKSTLERWTFPKGHLEPGESALEAAMREAVEEAGARGVVDPDPLVPYLFPAGTSGASLVVIPFLMRTEEADDPSEPGRPIRWSSPEDAKGLLRLNREEPFANEHDRVIDQAIERFDEL